jgi:hypothetical protein
MPGGIRNGERRITRRQKMFDLEKAIKQWRKSLRKNQAGKPSER